MATFDPLKFVRPGKQVRRRRLKQAADFTAAMQYLGGIMAVTLVQEYGWTVAEVEELVEKMTKRTQQEREINGL